MKRLSDEDRITAIEAKLGAGETVPEDDVIWLCRRLRGFAVPRLDEYDFPEYCGLISRDSKKSVAVRQLRKSRIEKEIRDGQAHAIQALDYVVAVPETDAVVVVRPWVKTKLLPGDPGLETLSRRFDLKLYVDHVLIGEAPIGEFLMAADGIGLRTIRPKLILTREHQLARAALCDDGYQTVTPDQTFGMALLNGQRVGIILECQTSWPVPDLLVGLTAAQYTSRSAANGTSVNLPGAI